jgi:hypothetical protein
VPSSKFQVPSSKFQVPSSKFQVPSSKFQVPSSKVPAQAPAQAQWVFGFGAVGAGCAPNGLERDAPATFFGIYGTPIAYHRATPIIWFPSGIF